MRRNVTQTITHPEAYCYTNNNTSGGGVFTIFNNGNFEYITYTKVHLVYLQPTFM